MQIPATRMHLALQRNVSVTDLTNILSHAGLKLNCCQVCQKVLTLEFEQNIFKAH